MNVSNRKCVCTLARRSLRASRTRNLIAVLAIALTTVLFTSLFTIALSINDGFQQNNFRQVGGYSHGGFKYLTEAQYEALKDDPLIGQAGLRRFVGMPTQAPFNKAHVEVSYADANDAHWMYCDPAEGRLPQEGTDEAATDTHVLELLGVEPELGARFTLTFDVDGHETTQTFTLSGWWEYDEAIVANHVLLPESRVDALLEHHARRLDELTAISRMLQAAIPRLKTGGRLAVISFPSLEDRIVKSELAAAAKGCDCPPSFPVCVCGKRPLVRLVNRKPILPSQAEQEENPRARSAKLRVAEKLEG